MRRLTRLMLVGSLAILQQIHLSHRVSFFAAAGGTSDGSEGDDDDFLAEILAEEARQEEEHAKMEAEAREFDAMKARQPSGGGIPNMNRGKPKMGGAGGNFSKMEEDLKRREAESATKRATQEEELNAEKAEKIRQQREARFERELQKMNQDQRKKELAAKKRDAKVVQRILKFHKAGRHYAVLGIRNFEVQIGPYYIFNLAVGPFALFRVKTKAIKRVYRNLARTVHPDKNRDGRAEEAFHALESSAAILTDDKKRSDYDKRLTSARRRRNKYAIDKLVDVSSVAWNRSAQTVRVAKKFLGPFSTPILVIGALII